jgi:hypothetical protein
MYCTGEDVLVVFDRKTEEFTQIEVPLDENEDIDETRSA